MSPEARAVSERIGSRGRRRKSVDAKAHDPLFDQFCRADALWDAGRPRAARRLFHSGALAGDPSSQLNYGYFLEQGLGGPRDRRQAMRWYRAAYRRGATGAAANNIAILLREDNRVRLAAKWFERAIAGGEVGAALELGKLCRDALHSVTRARKYFRVVARSPRSSESEKEKALALLAALGR